MDLGRCPSANNIKLSLDEVRGLLVAVIKACGLAVFTGEE